MIHDMAPERCRELREALPSDGDPKLQDAMQVWHNLTEAERTNVFRGLYSQVVAFQRTGDVGHLEMMEDGLHTMVIMEQQPGFTESRRKPVSPMKPGEKGAGFQELIRQLRS